MDMVISYNDKPRWFIKFFTKKDMKKKLICTILLVSFNILSTEEKTVSDLTVEELTQIVREIIQESLEKCLVSGSMEGRAKVNLAVVGSVEAKMVCDFEEKLD